MKLSNLSTRVETLSNARVLCIGDIMLDRFIYGSVERTSPEAPVPVLRIINEKKMLGGAGNVVRNIVSLGAKATLISVVGDDSVGRELTSMVGSEPDIEPCLLVESGRASTQKTRFVAESQQLLRADYETNDPISEKVADNLIRMAKDIINESDVLILSDYAKGVIGEKICETLIAIARNENKEIVIDPKGSDFSKYKYSNIITPNRNELANATGLSVQTSEEIIRAADTLIKKYNIDHVLVTKSSEGISLVSSNGKAAHLKAQAREVYDVSGAGDTVVAALATSLGANISLYDSARLANTAAGVVVEKAGTAVAEISEIVHALRANDLSDAEAKIIPLSTAIHSIASWRNDGEKIGFTNGCFDLLHPGHISLLRQARANCDRLIVGLNSDISVKRLKGSSRPIQGENARAQVLASLETVDLVVIFEEETPVTLIESILPDVLIKGSDYTEEQVVGADIVRENGGKVLLANLESGYSTTETISRLQK